MKKSSDYIEVLVLEQKARKWLDKAVEESDKADKLKAEGAESHRPWFGAGGKIHKFFGGGSTNQFGSDPASVAYNKSSRTSMMRKRMPSNVRKSFRIKPPVSRREQISIP